MILTCPQCETRYEADASKFAPPGRKVRCAKCGHIWHQDAPAPDPVAKLETNSQSEAEPVLAPSSPSSEAEPRSATFVPATERTVAGLTVKRISSPPAETKSTPRASQTAGMIAGWLGLVLVILVIGWSALTYRQQIATMWPQAASLYSALGMHVNTRGLDFVDVSIHSETEDGQPVWAVTGKLVNISTREQSVPPIEVVLTDNNKRAINRWRFGATAYTLRPGQQVEFRWRLASPPAGARHLELHFAAAGG